MRESDADVVQEILVNMDSNRDDIKPLLDKINPLLKQVLDILVKNPEECSDDDEAAGFSKIMYSRVSTVR